MKKIKKVVLNETTQLSHEEMKHVFGGSSTTEDGSGCFLSCGDEVLLSSQISGCNICVASGGKMFCKEKISDANYTEYGCKQSGTSV